ncbi:hypothetical protein BS78_03G375600, partial [Paspalum vaginatum]
LYLALDDSEAGYSIHKIDVGDFDPDDADDDLDSRPRRPLDSPLLRVEAERQSANCFVALGTKIFAMQPSSSPGRAAFALDTRTMAITAGPLPQAKEQQLCASNFVVVGDRLYSMGERDGDGSCSFEVLGLSSGSRSWSWSSVPSQPLFDPTYVYSYAVHPDGRTIFFSIPSSHHDLDPPFRRSSRSCDDNGRGATFSFDTEALKWTFRGYWSLPFYGQGHYDVELDAWVAIHDEFKGARLCCCDVLPPATGEDDVDRLQQAPARKLARDRLFRIKGGRRRHRDGALVYMGSSSFCFLERITDKVLTWEQLLYVRTFGIKYDNKGRLRMATCGRRARCYLLPEGTS